MRAKGASLPMMSCPGRDGGHDELLQRAKLLFLDDGQGGQDGRDDHEDHRQDAGHHEVPAGKRRVVQDADGRVHLHGLDLAQHAGVQAGKPGRRPRGLRAGDDQGGVGEPDGRGLGIRAVGQELQRRALCPVQRPAEPGRDDERQGGSSLLYASLRALRVRHVHACDVASGLQEAGDKLPAFHAVVLVADGQGDVLHIHVCRVPQERNLQDGGQEDQGKEPTVPAQLLELLSDDEADGPHLPLLRRSTLSPPITAAKMRSASTWSPKAWKPTPFTMIARSAAR